MGTVLRNVRPVFGPTDQLSIRLSEGSLVEASSFELSQQSDDDVIDAGGRYAFPGFVNAHTHLAMVLFRGLADDVPLKTWLEKHIWPIEQRLSPEDVYWCALLACAEAIRGGTTCLVDMYFHVEEVARAIEDSGLRALLSYGMIAESREKNGRTELEKTRTFIQAWHGSADGRIRVAVAPHTLYTVGSDVWQDAVAMAHDLNVPINTHVAETRREVEEWRSQTGESPVTTLNRLGALDGPMLAAHCVHVDSKDIEILARKGVVVGHCPKSNAKLGSGIAPIAAMTRAGVTVGIGTDGAGSNNRLDMFEELRATWIAQRALHEDPTVLSGREVIEMAITAPRVPLGFPSGAFEPGETADIVLIDPNGIDVWPPHDPVATLAYAATSSSVTDVIVAGKRLMKDGELLTIDEERVQSEVERLLRRHVNI